MYTHSVSSLFLLLNLGKIHFVRLHRPSRVFPKSVILPPCINEYAETTNQQSILPVSLSPQPLLICLKKSLQHQIHKEKPAKHRFTWINMPSDCPAGSSVWQILSAMGWVARLLFDWEMILLFSPCFSSAWLVPNQGWAAAAGCAACDRWAVKCSLVQMMLPPHTFHKDETI